jgi:mono/diheme cytochrome c family protein
MKNRAYRFRRLIVCAAAAAVTLAGCSRAAARNDGGRPANDASPEMIAQGQELYRSNGCAVCHAMTGSGDGPVGKTLAVRPRDLRDERSFKNGSTVDDIAATIEIGLGEGDAKMPAYPHLSLADRTSIARFIVSLRTIGSQTPSGGAHP